MDVTSIHQNNWTSLRQMSGFVTHQKTEIVREKQSIHIMKLVFILNTHVRTKIHVRTNYYICPQTSLKTKHSPPLWHVRKVKIILDAEPHHACSAHPGHFTV